MEGLPDQHFADLHDRLNIGTVRRVPSISVACEAKTVENTSAESNVACNIATKFAGALGVPPPILRDTRMVLVVVRIRL